MRPLNPRLQSRHTERNDQQPHRGENRTLNSRITFFTLSLLVAATIVPQMEQSGAEADRVDDLIGAEMRRQRIPGLSLAVLKEGEIIKAEGYGVCGPGAEGLGHPTDRLQDCFGQQTVHRHRDHVVRATSCCSWRAASSSAESEHRVRSRLRGTTLAGHAQDALLFCASIGNCRREMRDSPNL